MLGSLLVSYHERSEVALEPSDERRLADRLTALGLHVQFDSNSLPIAGSYSPPVGSWVEEHIGLLLVVSGSLVAKTLIQEMTKDLYKFFKDLLQRARSSKGNSQIHYGVMLDVYVEGRRYNVAISFKDEETMQISMYRLSSSISKAGQLSSSRPVLELTYPTGYNLGYAVPLTAIVVLVIGTAAFGFEKLPWLAVIVNRTGVLTYRLLLGLIAIALYVRIIIIPWHRERSFRKLFRKDAQNWAEEISRDACGDQVSRN